MTRGREERRVKERRGEERRGGRGWSVAVERAVLICTQCVGESHSSERRRTNTAGQPI